MLEQPSRSAAHQQLRAHQTGCEGIKRTTQEMRARRHATCPSCGNTTTFSLTGEQRWPEKIAAAAGLPAVVQLWTCCACGSTISDTDLK